jgi:hypothetical protein
MSTSQTSREIRQKAVMGLPPELEQMKEKAGTRAEILDIAEIDLGDYGDHLRQGFNRLDLEMERIENPKECLEQCTIGFHYAFDSRQSTPQVVNVCTNSKCLAQKKAACTRAKNADGLAKKKAEAAAIKKAVSETIMLDLPRLKLVILAFLKKGWVYQEGDPRQWFAEAVGLKKDKELGEIQHDVLFKQIEGLGVEKINKLIVEFCLSQLMYHGGLENYRIETTQALTWMGINPNAMLIHALHGQDAKAKKEKTDGSLVSNTGRRGSRG